MKRVLALLMLVVFALLSACAAPSGAGNMPINDRAVAYGIGENGVAFVIFTDLSTTEGVFSRVRGESGFFSSRQSGSVQSNTGKLIEYVGEDGVLTINGQEFSLADGAVFLVTTEEDNANAQQLNLPIEATAEFTTEKFQEEVRRIAENPDVNEFMKDMEAD